MRFYRSVQTQKETSTWITTLAVNCRMIESKQEDSSFSLKFPRLKELNPLDPSEKRVPLYKIWEGDAQLDSIFQDQKVNKQNCKLLIEELLTCE